MAPQTEATAQYENDNSWDTPALISAFLQRVADIDGLCRNQSHIAGRMETWSCSDVQPLHLGRLPLPLLAITQHTHALKHCTHVIQTQDFHPPPSFMGCGARLSVPLLRTVHRGKHLLVT
ncbi:hypothetical protein E2C01_067497 [Portunus trituberculatus]|uniref:Uncharacterized protein n=1 Tax=Portunus trituberculatus TaxID=210409 RepID=A0A5B7HTT3_PORTR|nr:hypothetical protein [Portunus trituberculatus]